MKPREDLLEEMLGKLGMSVDRKTICEACSIPSKNLQRCIPSYNSKLKPQWLCYTCGFDFVRRNL